MFQVSFADNFSLLLPTLVPKSLYLYTYIVPALYIVNRLVTLVISRDQPQERDVPWVEEERELGSTADNNASHLEKQDIPIKVRCWRLQECVSIILLSFCEFIKGWIVYCKWWKTKK